MIHLDIIYFILILSHREILQVDSVIHVPQIVEQLQQLVMENITLECMP